MTTGRPPRGPTSTKCMRPSGVSNQLGSYGQVPSKVQSASGAMPSSYSRAHQRTIPAAMSVPTEEQSTVARMAVRASHDGREDLVAVEEPLEIRVDAEPLAVTMRTPGHDEELALGFLHGEGLIDGARKAGSPEDLAANAIEVAGPLPRDPGERLFYTTSSCGVCGKGALEQVAVQAPRVGEGPAVARDLLASLPDRLSQPAFERTGGLHATGLFTPT